MHARILACLVFALSTLAPLVVAQEPIPALVYPPGDQQLYAIPEAERNLPTITAQRWLKVSDKGLLLEGPAFDRNGNLFLIEVFGGQVLKVDIQQRLSVVVQKNALGSAGLAIHKDGRLFVAGLGNFNNTGNLTAYQPDGTGRKSLPLANIT